MKHKILLVTLTVGFAGSTLACGVMDNLVDRAVDEASEVVIEQIEEQTGEDPTGLDADQIQATADAYVPEFTELEDVIPEGYGATGESGFAVMEGGVVLIEDATMINYTLEGATVADVSAFYRDLFLGLGMSEKTSTTVESDLSASITFVNDPEGGNDIVLAAANLDDSVLVTVTREADY